MVGIPRADRARYQSNVSSQCPLLEGGRKLRLFDGRPIRGGLRILRH